MHKGESFEIDRVIRRSLFQSDQPDSRKETLLQCKDQLQTVIELIDDAFLIHDNGNIRMANKAAAELFNATDPKDLYGRSVFEFAHDDSMEKIQKDFLEASSGIVSSEEPVMAQIVSEQGRVAEVEVKSYPLSCISNGRVVIQTVIQSKENTNIIEEKLMEANRLDMLSTIAGGIAHNFNNFLAVMLGNIALCKKNAGKVDDITSTLDCIENSILQAKHLSQQLLVYAREGVPVRKTVSVEQLIRDITKFTLSGTSVYGEVAISEKLCPVNINEGQIAQVLNNLLINAMQAMPEGGTVTVEACTIKSDRACREIPLTDGAKGDFLKLSVRDEGVGIPESVMDNLFKPFFTTKKEGVGLGLATSLSIIKKHDGHINVLSEPGKGATFNIYLPASTAPLPVSAENTSQKTRPGYGRVLVMDDNEAIRTITGEMLSMLGYEADLAGDGKEAIELYKAGKATSQPYRLVLMDLAVPGGMNGETAINKLLETDPEVRIVVSSGYVSYDLMADYSQKGLKGVIAKPYNVQELSEMLQKALE